MKNFAKTRNIFSLSLLITGVAFLAGAIYVFAGIPGTQNLKCPGKYVVELAPGEYDSYIYHRWDSVGISSDYDGNNIIKILDSSRNEIVDYNEARDSGHLILGYPLLGKDGYFLHSFTIKKPGEYEVSTSNPLNKAFVLSLVPAPKEQSLFWHFLFFLELSKDHFCNQRVQ